MPLEGGARLLLTLNDMKRRFTSQSVSAGLYDPEVATYAYWNEYGVPDKNIPPRPFMHTTFEIWRSEWVDILRRELKHGKNSKDALKVVGFEMAKNINFTLQTSIGRFVKNADRTKAKKGFDHPLLETGRMFHSVKFRIGKVEAT